MIINERNFSTFAKSIAYPADPEEYSQAAVDRLMDIMDPYVVRIAGVKPQFRANNKVRLIDFETREDFEFYQKAWERYLEEKAKIEAQADGTNKGETRFSILVQFLKFRQAAEICRARFLAREMYECVMNGKAAAAALNFRPTITKIAMIWINDFNVSRDEISLIWGGAQVKQTKKGKIKKSLIENEKLLMALAAEGIDLDSIGMGENVEVKEEVKFDPALRMGSQNAATRQFEIDQYQRGISKYCLFTFKAGGVGLSLHHTDELTTDWNRQHPDFDNWFLDNRIDKYLTGEKLMSGGKKLKKGKARRKESGYAFESDIPFITTRPRKLFCAPTYSAIELVQALGRLPRLTSLSDTDQDLIFFRGTIEERVAAITSMKLRCLSKVVRQREHWEDIITGHDPEAVIRQLEQSSKSFTDDTDDDSIMGSDIGDEEDDE